MIKRDQTTLNISGKTNKTPSVHLTTAELQPPFPETKYIVNM